MIKNMNRRAMLRGLGLTAAGLAAPGLVHADDGSAAEEDANPNGIKGWADPSGDTLDQQKECTAEVVENGANAAKSFGALGMGALAFSALETGGLTAAGAAGAASAGTGVIATTGVGLIAIGIFIGAWTGYVFLSSMLIDGGAALAKASGGGSNLDDLGDYPIPDGDIVVVSEEDVDLPDSISLDGVNAAGNALVRASATYLNAAKAYLTGNADQQRIAGFRLERAMELLEFARDEWRTAVLALPTEFWAELPESWVVTAEDAKAIWQAFLDSLEEHDIDPDSLQGIAIRYEAELRLGQVGTSSRTVTSRELIDGLATALDGIDIWGVADVRKWS